MSTFPPYTSLTIRRVRNNEDRIYVESNGTMTHIPIQFLTNQFTGGMTGEVTVGIDPAATPTPVGGPRPPGPPPGRR